MTNKNANKTFHSWKSIWKSHLRKWQPFCPGRDELTHWGRVTHICFGKLTIIGSNNGLLPGRRQAIIWTNAGIFFIEPSGTNFSEILIGIHIFSLKKMHLKMSSAKWRPFCLGLSVLRHTWVITSHSFADVITYSCISLITDLANVFLA